MIYAFDGYIPVVDETSFVHPLAAVTGNVVIGKNCYIGPGAAIRGDWGRIVLEDGVNVQENCTLHMFPGKNMVLQQDAHVGHGAIVHGAQIGKNVMIGMNAVIMDDVVVGDDCIIGALTFVKANMVIPNRKIVVGNPAKIVKDVSDEQLAWKTKGTEIYKRLPSDCFASLKEVAPRREVSDDNKVKNSDYKPWHETNDKSNPE